MSERAAPMFCPYCGEDQLRPWGDDPDRGHRDWRCEDCTRVFTLRYGGTGGAPRPAPPAPGFQVCRPHSVFA